MHVLGLDLVASLACGALDLLLTLSKRGLSDALNRANWLSKSSHVEARGSKPACLVY